MNISRIGLFGFFGVSWGTRLRLKMGFVCLFSENWENLKMENEK